LENKIQALQKLNEKMIDAMYENRPTKDVTREECRELWEETVWCKILKNEIRGYKNEQQGENPPTAKSYSPPQGL